ncbi:hypothetical protein CYMTET_21264 [Cymbomonas tetramitiformis]|uniref:Uncharacterized protein n=1 Tax=Cymbomonas tetramitiformis TaxID=36881 RepID=A0AAE0L3D9_9CHLO|nr:hypothetical protein CYMTET_21264 [Cymbomonas tetramitiformis]
MGAVAVDRNWKNMLPFCVDQRATCPPARELKWDCWVPPKFKLTHENAEDWILDNGCEYTREELHKYVDDFLAWNERAAKTLLGSEREV